MAYFLVHSRAHSLYLRKENIKYREQEIRVSSLGDVSLVEAGDLRDEGVVRVGVAQQ